MKKAINYARGSICVEVECPHPERFVNVCAQCGVEFWRLRRVSPTAVTAYMHMVGYKKLRSLAYNAGFDIKLLKESGIPFFLSKMRKRYVLLIGMALSLLTVHMVSLFIWEMQVVGNTDVPSRLILETLEELGVGIGSFGPAVINDAVANDVILRIPELSWIAVNVRGSRAQVLVRERIPRPDIIDEDRPVMIYAQKPGVVVRMTVLEGASAVNIGDTVMPGDVLVTGIMDSLSSGRRTVHAQATVYAQMWYEMSAKMPLEAVIKEHTGNTQTRRSLDIAGRRINLFRNGRISWSYYDKMTSKSMLRLPTGNTLPLTMITARHFEYTPIASALSVSDAETILRESLMASLHEEIGDGDIISAQFTTEVEGGVVTVTLIAECVEQIAVARDFTEEELMEAEMMPGVLSPPSD